MREQAKPSTHDEAWGKGCGVPRLNTSGPRVGKLHLPWFTGHPAPLGKELSTVARNHLHSTMRMLRPNRQPVSQRSYAVVNAPARGPITPSRPWASISKFERSNEMWRWGIRGEGRTQALWRRDAMS
jgi:hypothetical protein